jgi:hypothetical protein
MIMVIITIMMTLLAMAGLWYCWMNTWDDDKASCAAPPPGGMDHTPI